MDIKTIYANEFLVITKCHDGYYIESYKKGMTIQDFNSILKDNPEIKITSFTVIRDVLLNAPHPSAKFGQPKDRIFVEISNNHMNANLILNVDESELLEENRNKLIKEIITKLQESGVIFGVDKDTLYHGLENSTNIPIAEGIPPINGEDSLIRMFELKNPTPEIKEDGKADYYDLNLINRVSKGDWLGDRKDPGNGTPGKTVKGEIIDPLPGKRLPLFYDTNTVREDYKDGITTLYSLINGAVHYNGEQISISNFLEITGDVDFKTGNIDFDGFLTVKGVVGDNFTVTASNDIEILGEFGIGSVKEIVSRNGSVYVKGGISGKNKAIIRSSKDIYTKFISDATVICEGNVYVGFYCMNSNVIAKQLIIDSSKGQIIGGKIQAEQKVAASFFGNVGERRTTIAVTGFDRKSFIDKLEILKQEIEIAKCKLAKAKQVFAIYSYSIDTGSKQYKEYEKAKEDYFNSKDAVRRLELEIKALISCFKVKGEGEIEILKRAYPNTALEIKNMIREIKKETLTSCFFLQEGEIKEI